LNFLSKIQESAEILEEDNIDGPFDPLFDPSNLLKLETQVEDKVL
jgi:hypothetical protein